MLFAWNNDDLILLVLKMLDLRLSIDQSELYLIEYKN
ncbi:unnamed protein product [Amoebophrya sp. A25]|nr:unnamed protein product [Amoebophrya sp. A25]|eukprot:GSA25T00012958001.1